MVPFEIVIKVGLVAHLQETGGLFDGRERYFLKRAQRFSVLSKEHPWEEQSEPYQTHGSHQGIALLP